MLRVSSAAIAVAIPLFIYFRKSKFRLLQMNSFRERVLWSFHAWRCGNPVLPDAEKWKITDVHDVDKWGEEARAFIRIWTSLAPFFLSHGYTLYQSQPPKFLNLYPAPNGPYPKSPPQYPFARRFYMQDECMLFTFIPPRVWVARDSGGRDVVVRLASGRDGPSPELQIFQRLNTDKARADPRNHTLQVLDYLTYDGLTFVVMPRWDGAFDHEFCNVDEVFQTMEAFLETYDFLHENRIAHLDFLEQNTATNLLIRQHSMHLPGTRNPAETRYAIIDFGSSLIYPLDTVLEDVQEARDYFFDIRSETEPAGPQNPFRVDMFFLGVRLESRFRVLEEIIPEIGPFFDIIANRDLEKLPSAAGALRELQTLRKQLTEDQRRATFTGYLWRNGQVYSRKRAPRSDDLAELNMYLQSQSQIVHQ